MNSTKKRKTNNNGCEQMKKKQQQLDAKPFKKRNIITKSQKTESE